jgi:hypothetical protein
MSTPLVPVLIAVTVGPSTPTPTGAAFASTSVIVTDSSGTPQPAVLLNGS